MGYYPSDKDEVEENIKRLLKEIGFDKDEPLWTCWECNKEHNEHRCPRCGCPERY